MMLFGAILLASMLQFGTKQEPLVSIDVDRAELESVAADAVAGMTKVHSGDVDIYYRAPDADDTDIDVIVGRGGKLFRVAGLTYAGFNQPDVTSVGAATNDASIPIVRFELTNGHGNVFETQEVLVDLRDVPRAVTIDAVQAFGRGACGGPEAYFSRHTFMTCDWSASRADIVCRQAVTQNRDWSSRIAWRSFTIFGEDELKRERDVRPEELLTSTERTVAGEGVVEPVAIADGVELFVLPATDRTFELHGWLVDRKRHRVIAVKTMTLDEEEVAPRTPRDDEQPYTADRQHVDIRRIAPIRDGALTVVPFTIKDGSATGLFWFGYDGADGSLLRVATDAYEHRRCNFLVRPASAMSRRIVASPFSATLHVEGAAPQWKGDDVDESPCRYDAHVTWKKGFVIERSGEKDCDARRRLTVHADGTVTATALPPQP
jgi:hypothetical protein